MTPPEATAALPRRSPACFLPTTREAAQARGWDELDVLLVNGDAYVDHPSFGTAVIGRAGGEGLPRGSDRTAGLALACRYRADGAPRLFAGVTSGAMDSMVNHHTAHERRRSDDAYTPDGVAVRRPDRATTVQTRLVREVFGPTLPVLPVAVQVLRGGSRHRAGKGRRRTGRAGPGR